MGDAFLGLFYVAAFGVGFILAIAAIAIISIFAPVHLGVAFLSALGVGACTVLLARLVNG